MDGEVVAFVVGDVVVVVVVFSVDVVVAVFVVGIDAVVGVVAVVFLVVVEEIYRNLEKIVVAVLLHQVAMNEDCTWNRIRSYRTGHREKEDT